MRRARASFRGMRASVGLVLAGLAATALAGACFDFDATTAGGPLADGGSTARDAGVPEARVPADATTESGDGAGDAPAVVPEAGAGDASDSGVPETGTFCASIGSDAGLLFCDDFDEKPLPNEWQTWGQMGGTLVESDASALSPPSSADEITYALDGGQVINVALRTTLGVPPLPAKLRFGFGIEPVTIDTTANAAIVLGAVDFLDGAGNRYTAGLSVDVVSGKPALVFGEQSSFADGGTTYTQHPLDATHPLPVNQWTDIVLEIDWTAPTTATATVTVTGPGAAPPLTTPLAMTVTATSLQIGVGTSYVTQPSPGWELRYDNVRLFAN